MRRPLWLRVVIAVWAVWLGATLVGPAEGHACPVHGDHAAHGMATAGMSGAEQMSDMAAMPEMEHAAHHGTTDHKPNAQCTCVGACCSAATVAPPASQVAEISVDEPVVSADFAAFARDDRAPVAAPPHSLPFANGPPARA